MKYRVIRKLTDEENFSDTELEIDDIIYSYSGCTYGCIADGIACCRIQHETPFFEMPEDAIELIKEI